MDAEIERFRREAEDAGAWTSTGERKGVQLSRRIQEEESSTSVTCVRGVGIVQAPPERVFPIAWMPDRWRSWSRNLEEAAVLRTIDPRSRYVYTRYAGRFPVAPRDMVTLQTYRHYADEDTYVIFCRSAPPAEAEDLMPEEDGVVRAEVFQTGFIIKPLGPASTVTFVSHADFKGWIPLWFQNMVAGFQPLVVQKIAAAALEGALVPIGSSAPLFDPSSLPGALPAPTGLRAALAPGPRAAHGHAVQRGAQSGALPVDEDGYVVVEPPPSGSRHQEVAA